MLASPLPHLHHHAIPPPPHNLSVSRWNREEQATYRATSSLRCSTTTFSNKEATADNAAFLLPNLSAMKIMTGPVNALFSYKPFFQFAADRAREMIMKRGTEIGYPWAPELAKLRLHDWSSEFKAVQNPTLQYPDYYLKPFHAYVCGNLSWDAALEAELAAKAVHANVFDPERKKLDRDGDEKLRDSYHRIMCNVLERTPNAIVDIGCATGLSTFRLHETFPDAHIIGVDLSPFFLSVANYRLKEKAEQLDKTLPVHFFHAAGEHTGLPSGAFDLVTLCLVCHELPRHATQQIIKEAHRLLKRGGALAIMDMNPLSLGIKKMANNILAFTAFKSTEPYFDDYITFHIESAIKEAGFTYPSQCESSPQHRTIIAHKE